MGCVANLFLVTLLTDFVNSLGNVTMISSKFENTNLAELLLESMADGVFALDELGRIILWNPAMERISGYQASEVMGQGCGLLGFNRCYGRSCPTGIEECQIFSLGELQAKECFLRHKLGHDVPVVKSAQVVRGDQEQCLGVVETVTDLSELFKARQKAEQALFKLGEIHRLDKIIGQSHAMQQVFAAVKAAAASEATVLIQGESGTGKELVAGAIHFNSSRAEGPLVVVNCSSLPEGLLESELFGHVRGAFTGAVRGRKGRFEEAHTGTIFLDEIGEITPYIQVKLLRVLQERSIERVGESKKRELDIRIIAATNKDLGQLVEQGLFRSDFFYRLKVFPINLPPLRERREDIPLLVSFFIRQENEKTGKSIQGLTQGALRILMDYHWPGNVRELENAIEHAFVLCVNEYIDVFDLPVEIRQAKLLFPGSMSPDGPSRKRPTKEELVDLLDDCGWNKAEVARRLGLSRTAVWKYMKKWNIPLKR